MINCNNGNSRKRHVAQSSVPVLIDNKRKHMEQQLSAAQRDKFMMEEVREEREFRREFSQCMQESNSLFADSLKVLSSSMAALASSMQKSMDLMSQSYSTQQQYQETERRK